MLHRFCRGLELVLRFARFDHRPVEGLKCFGQQGMFFGNPVKPSRGDAQGCQRRIRTFPNMPQLFQIARKLLALLHGGPGFCETCFFSRLRFQRCEFRKMGKQQVLVQLCLLQRILRLGQLVFGGAPCGPCLADPHCVSTSKAIEQRAVAARVHQSAIIVLSMQFDEVARHLAQQAHADRLIIDEGLALAIGLELSPDDQRFAFLYVDICVVEQFGKQVRQSREFKTGRGAGLVFTTANKTTVGTVAQHQA